MKKQSDIIKSLTDRQLLFHLYVTQLLILFIAVVLSYFFFDGVHSLLNLIQWSDWKAYVIGGGAGLIVVIIDLVLYKLLPSHYYDDGGINERIFLNRHPFHILLLAILIAISEELLFRGVLQNVLGWFLASTLFAVIHFRYFSHWFLSLNITLLSFLIGYIYMVTDNLMAPIVMHMTVDFLLGLFLKIQKKREKEGVTNIAK